MTPGSIRPQYGDWPPAPPHAGMRPRLPPPPMGGGPMLGGPMPWLPPPPGSMPMRPGMMPPRPPPMFAPRGPPGGPRPPMWPPMMRPRHMMPMRPRGMMPGRIPPHMRPRFPIHNHKGLKVKSANSTKSVITLEDMRLMKPWMTDEIRNEIQKKNKLYAKASKNKNAKEWEQFKDLRNKVTRMIRDAKNEFNAKNKGENGEDDEDDKVEGEEDDEEETEENDKVEESDENAQEIPQNEAEYANYYYYYWYYNGDYNGDYSEAYSGGVEEVNVENVNSEDVEIFSCDICIRDFPSQEKLTEHISTHEVCGIDGCTFTAHPKLIEKHYSIQHATGLYKRMKSITDDEKYIAERRRRFPTLTNITKKMAEQEEKKNRGEVVEQRTKSKKSHDKSKQTAPKRKRRKNNASSVELEKVPEPLYKGLRMFGGMDTLSNDLPDTETNESKELKEEKDDAKSDANFCISDDEDESNRTHKTESDKPNVLSALSLLAGYGSGSDSDEPPEEVPVKKLKTEVESVPEKSVEKMNINEITTDSDKTEVQSVPQKVQEEVKTEKISNTPSNQTIIDDGCDKYVKFDSKCVPVSQNAKQKNQEARKRSVNKARKVNDRSLQFLEKLLARDIQHERNIIFQCIKYIHDNNFFEES